jgi:hydrogenase 3 maturation protease
MNGSLEKLSSELADAERVAVLTVGSEVRGDDAVGLVVGHFLEEAPTHGLCVFVGSNAPENCTGPIRQYAPSHLVIVDAADFGCEPGAVRLLDAARLREISFTTQALPLTVVVDYLLKSLENCRVIVVGIQPGSLFFGARLTEAVAHAAREVAAALREAVAGRAAGRPPELPEVGPVGPPTQD